MRCVSRQAARLAARVSVPAARSLRLHTSSIVAPTARSLLSARPLLARSAQPHRAFSTSNAGTVVVVADHDNSKLLDSTLNVVSAARKLSPSSLLVLVLASPSGGAKVAAQAAKLQGVNKVLLMEDAAFEHAMAEQSSTIAAIAKENNATHILGSTSANGKNILPRLGAHLDVQPITDVIGIESADTFVRPVYAGNAISTVQSSDAIKVLTVRPTSFEKAEQGDKEAAVEKVSAPVDPNSSKSVFEKEELSVSERPELASARIVVSGGRGLKSKENFAIIEELADAMGAAVGASRAAVDAGYVPNDYQVGQTGKVVAPDLYVAVGISGAIQHLAGMKDSKVIVAINKDKEAPIFQVADYGLEGDLFKIVPELTKAVKEAKQK